MEKVYISMGNSKKDFSIRDCSKMTRFKAMVSWFLKISENIKVNLKIIYSMDKVNTLLVNLSISAVSSKVESKAKA